MVRPCAPEARLRVDGTRHQVVLVDPRGCSCARSRQYRLRAQAGRRMALRQGARHSRISRSGESAHPEMPYVTISTRRAPGCWAGSASRARAWWRFATASIARAIWRMRAHAGFRSKCTSARRRCCAQMCGAARRSPHGQSATLEAVMAAGTPQRRRCPGAGAPATHACAALRGLPCQATFPSVVCGDLVHRLAREERLVRGHDHVRKHQKTREHVVLKRQVRVILEKEAAFFSRTRRARDGRAGHFQRTDQRVAFHETAAAGIDQHRAALHFRERAARRSGGTSPGSSGQCRLTTSRFGEQRVERHVACAEREQILGGRAGIVGKHAACRSPP